MYFNGEATGRDGRIICGNRARPIEIACRDDQNAAQIAAARYRAGADERPLAPSPLQAGDVLGLDCGVGPLVARGLLARALQEADVIRGHIRRRRLRVLRSRPEAHTAQREHQGSDPRDAGWADHDCRSGTG
jgi:hypothetical protein